MVFHGKLIYGKKTFIISCKKDRFLMKKQPAQPLAASFTLQGSPQAWKFMGGEAVAELISASVLPIFQTCGEPCR